MVTAAQADALIAEPKVIAANLAWRFTRGAYRLEATVLAEESQAILSLRGYVGIKNRSLALLYRNTPIRKYTVHDRHTDPKTGVRVAGPHKHFWDDVYQDNRVYIPDDIHAGNPNEELADFLRECNIALRSVYTRENFSRFNQRELL